MISTKKKRQCLLASLWFFIEYTIFHNSVIDISSSNIEFVNKTMCWSVYLQKQGYCDVLKSDVKIKRSKMGTFGLKFSMVRSSCNIIDLSVF